MNILSLVLPTLVGTLIAGLLFLFIARRSDPATFRTFVLLAIVMVLGATLTDVAKIELSISSTLGSIVVGAVVGVLVAAIVVGAAVVLGFWKKAKPTDA